MKTRMVTAIALFVIGMVMLFGSLAHADTEEPINTTIDSTTWTAITLDGVTPCTSYCFQSRDGSDFKWKKTATSTNYFTVRDGTAIGVTFNSSRPRGIIFYAQSASGTPVIEVFILNQ